MLLRAMLLRMPNGVKGIVSSPPGLTISVTILIKYFQWYLKSHIFLSNTTVLHLKQKKEFRFVETEWKSKH